MRRTTARVTIGLAAAGVLAMSLAGTANAQNPVGPSSPRAAGFAVPAETNPVPAARAYTLRFLKPPTRIYQNVPLKSPAPTGKTFVFLNAGTSTHNVIAAGIQEALAAIGWNYTQITYSTANPATLQQAMLNALAMNPAAVGASGVNPDVIGASVLGAYGDAGVPFIVSNCPLTPKVPIFAGPQLCAGEQVAGKALANWFIADSLGKGKALVQSMPAYGVLVEFTNTFKAEVAAKCPQCSVETLEFSLQQFAAQQVTPGIVNKIRSGDYNYLVLDNPIWSPGIENALKAAGVGNVKIIGRAANDATIANLKSGTNTAFTAQSYLQVGYGFVDSALRVITKSSGISKNAALPIMILTQKNVDLANSPYNRPASSLAQYRALWKR
jgi:ribose transport system substrate-binding protein